MKQILAMGIILCLAFSLLGCGNFTAVAKPQLKDNDVHAVEMKCDANESVVSEDEEKDKGNSEEAHALHKKNEKGKSAEAHEKNKSVMDDK